MTENNVSDDILLEKIKPSMSLIKSILKTYLCSKLWLEQVRTKHIFYALRKNKLHDALEAYLLFSIGEKLWCKLAEITVYYHFVAMLVDAKDIPITVEGASPHLQAAFNLLEKAMAKEQLGNVIELTVLLIANYYETRRHLSLPRPKEPLKDPTKFAAQIVTMQLVPISHFAKDQFNIDWGFLMLNDLPSQDTKFDQHINEIPTKYRDLLREMHFTPNLALSAIYAIHSSVHYYYGATPMAMFQMLAYLFDDISKCLSMNAAQKEIALNNYQRFYSGMVQVLKQLIQHPEFDSSDYDNSVCMLGAVMDFLEVVWPERVSNKFQSNLLYNHDYFFL